jgi:hypothetical protein
MAPAQVVADMVLAAAVVRVPVTQSAIMEAPEVQAPRELLFSPGTNNLVTIIPGRKPPFGGFFVYWVSNIEWIRGVHRVEALRRRRLDVRADGGRHRIFIHDGRGRT